jgi:hypothetical protein
LFEAEKARRYDTQPAHAARPARQCINAEAHSDRAGTVSRDHRL